MKGFFLFSTCIALLTKFSYSLDIVKRCGDKFVLDGRTFYFTGSNNYYLHYKDIEYATPKIFEIAKKHNLNVLRTFAFMDEAYIEEGVYYTSLNNVTREIEVNEGENGLQRLDKVIALAEQHDIRLIIAFTNNWADFGGMEQWVREFGFTEHYQFYTEPEIKKSYKKYVETIINRTNTITGKKYKDDGTIFSWELANEPRCWGTNMDKNEKCTTETVTSWIDEMSTFVKSIDSEHMVSSGEEGFGLAGVDTDNDIYGFGDGNDFVKNASLENIDFATIHLYATYWGFKDLVNEGIQYIESHANAVKKQLNKPIIMEEFGLPFDKRDEIYPKYMQNLIDNDYNGIMFWMIAHDEYPNYDGFNMYDKNITTYVDDYTPIQNAKSGEEINFEMCKVEL
ncbi:glycoside hydrolase [Neocallimastix lanati (nom. inval.)]|jgi:mannan endo-1,4-beta-mannosidase|uniref:mannan endo-1,4-beta-mannosidase n=1 Tax=Neocallimastix californiae TaxID=1754190 RepID=A0A1Y2EZT8_9FUNG|nr:glycoside hydrolase [Neocallimastix sp. JGI-2020a]ORY77119.1 glycoside hydrolase [Neocallimastix californiae]|eukprot:ORY77119.1 glycoside hydrolase [Neocallimastix californiae]